MQKPPQCLTRTFKHGIARILASPVHVSPAFDPVSHVKPINPSTCGATEFVAIWDTGATGTAISKKVVQDCGLKPIGIAKVNTANDERLSPVYLVSVFLPNRVIFPQLRVTECTIAGADVLIGMDIITRGDFAITNSDGRTTFSYRWPSSRMIDFVAESKAAPISQQIQKPTVKVGRNDPCPCGSGKKYKKCCGK